MTVPHFDVKKFHFRFKPKPGSEYKPDTSGIAKLQDYEEISFFETDLGVEIASGTHRIAWFDKNTGKLHLVTNDGGGFSSGFGFWKDVTPGKRDYEVAYQLSVNR